MPRGVSQCQINKLTVGKTTLHVFNNEFESGIILTRAGHLTLNKMGLRYDVSTLLLSLLLITFNLKCF